MIAHHHLCEVWLARTGNGTGINMTLDVSDRGQNRPMALEIYWVDLGEIIAEFLRKPQTRERVPPVKNLHSVPSQTWRTGHESTIASNESNASSKKLFHVGACCFHLSHHPGEDLSCK